MAFQISCLMFLVFLFVESNKGSEESCMSPTQIFDKEANKCCRKCPPGHHVTSKCTQGTETGCKACLSGKWSEGYSYHNNCFRCTKCDSEKGLMYDRNCSTTLDAKCICKPGKYCVMGYKKPYCSNCKSYTPCLPGSGVISAGTATTDVRCSECQPGTYSGQTSSTEKCRPHSTCGPRTILRRGNSTSDTVCDSGPYDVTTVSSTQSLRPPTTQSASNLNSLTAPDTTGLSTLTGPPDVNPVSSNGKPSTAVVIAPLVVFVGACIFVGIIIAICHLRSREGSPEKETKVLNGCVEAGILTSTSHPECQFLLKHSGPAEPTVSSDRPSMGPSSVPSSGPSLGPSIGHNGVSGCYVNQDDIRFDHPQSPTVHQVVNVNVNIVASSPTAPSAPSGSSTPRPNGRPPEPDNDLPLSQEEEDLSSCQVEQGKEAHTAVPETGREGMDSAPYTGE